MTKIVSPEEFNDAFLAVVRRRRVEIEKSWLDPPKYTRFFVTEANGVLGEVAQRVGLKYHQGCWGIDGVMYERYDETYLGDGWPEQLSVVVEHENFVGGTHGGVHQEVNKLSIYNSPLKVLVTYPYEKPRSDRLKGYADILRRADVFSDFTTHRRHLVIYGLRPNPENGVIWESYVYRLGEFVRLVVPA
jgi:hypothetical protein